MYYSMYYLYAPYTTTLRVVLHYTMSTYALYYATRITHYIIWSYHPEHEIMRSGDQVIRTNTSDGAVHHYTTSHGIM